MGTSRWYGPALAGLLAGTLASCAHREHAATAQRPPSPSEQSQQAYRQAAKDEQALADALKRADAAHQDVVKAQQQLTRAQQREEQERTRAQQLQLQARESATRANQQAQRGQLAAERAQGLETASGHVTQATPSRIVLEMQGGQMMSFQVDRRTTVLVGTERRSVSDIQQGADARVAYEPGNGGQPTAVTVHVTPSGNEATSPPAAAPGEPQPPPQR